MLVPIEVTWAIVNGGGANAFGTYFGSGTCFNTDTHAIEPYQATASGGINFQPPAAVHTAAGAVLWYECADDFTKTSWIYDGSGGFTITTDKNSTDCGWTPPLTCDLGTVSFTQTSTTKGAKLKFAFSGTCNGQAQYSLDGGAEQSSPTFPNVAAGKHSFKLRDDGLKDCTRTLEVEVVALGLAPTVPPAPVGPSQGVDFVGQPLWYPLTGLPANALVELELYAESAHGAADYALVLPLRKYANKKGEVAFQFDRLLWPMLSAFVPTPVATTSLCTTNLLNYFVRTTITALGKAPVVAVSKLRTALRGALPAEWQGTDYFAWRLGSTLPAPSFLSWQPLGAGTFAAGMPKPIVAGQPEWLFFLCPLALVDSQLQVRRTYFINDATAPVVEVEYLSRPGIGWAQRLLAIPISTSRAGVAGQSVRLETTSGLIVSQEARYTFVPASPRTRYLLFTNSLGGVDTLRCEGRLEVTLEATASAVERPSRYLPPAPAADSQVSDLVASRKLLLRTGWLAPADLEWLQELGLTREAWHQVGEQLRPLDLPKRSIATYSDEPSLRGLVLDFDYAYAPIAYAPNPYA
jgi:hypothetical protein